MGVLRHNNRMDIEALLNPSDELQMMDETTERTTDKEICQAVLAAMHRKKGPSIMVEMTLLRMMHCLHPCPTPREALYYCRNPLAWVKRASTVTRLVEPTGVIRR